MFQKSKAEAASQKGGGQYSSVGGGDVPVLSTTAPGDHFLKQGSDSGVYIEQDLRPGDY